jgi:hypothetical protein
MALGYLTNVLNQEYVYLLWRVLVTVDGVWIGE